jgi:hypothetical protein
MENCGTNCPNWAAPSSTSWIAPLEVASMTSRDEPSWPPGKIWMSSDPPVSSFTCPATRSIMVTKGCDVASTVAQRMVVAALAGLMMPAMPSAAVLERRKCRRVHDRLVIALSLFPGIFSDLSGAV